MWGIGGKGQGQGDKKEKRTNGLVVVAIDKDKGSQYALKWAVEHLMSRGQTIVLLHINSKAQSIPNPMGNNVSISDVKEEVAATYRQQLDSQMKELFLPFRCFCTRKEIHCKDIVLDDPDISKAITEFVSQQGVDNLVLGASSRGAFARRFKSTDVPTSVSKGVPDFCSVFVIAKGKISSIRSAVRQAPTSSPLRTSILGLQSQTSIKLDQSDNAGRGPKGGSNLDQRALRRDIYMDHRGLQPDVQAEEQILQHESESIKSPFLRGSKASNIRFADLSGADISFVSSGRPSSDRSSDFMDPNTPRLSSGSEAFDFRSSVSSTPHRRQSSSFVHDHSMVSQESGGSMWSPERTDDLDAEMRRLKLELKQTMDMYSAACKEALNAKQKARELHLWKLEEEQRLEESRLAGEAALAIAENEKLKCKAAIEAAEAAQRIAELEAQKRMNAEMKALKEAEEKKKAMDALAQSDTRYRKYSIEEIEEATECFADFRKIGEGGYGPVYKCYLDHTPVAIKVLRPDAAQGRSQFQQEVQVLSRMRHPNMVLLLGACPEYGCLVYEYMANGSLEDRLFRRGNTPVLPWQLRFRIAAEIGTGLLFLHQNKPEPLVHRDLKPANILLDRNYVSKISDVGLARLVPPSVANNVTQYHMTSAAGTFCYIDPEYQQTGMLGTKSDIYSLGIMLLQIITAKPPMGLTHFVERAIEKGIFAELLDPAVPDWPVEEALTFAKISLCCAELRRKDRPDLGSVVLPVLQKLASLADEYTFPGFLGGSSHASPNHSNASLRQDVMSDLGHSGYESRSSTSSIPGRQSFVNY